MLFSEIYGICYNVVAAVLAEAAEGCLTECRLTELVREKSFSENVLTIPATLKSGTGPCWAKISRPPSGTGPPCL